jgi:hypothetical protein
MVALGSYAAIDPSAIIAVTVAVQPPTRRRLAAGIGADFSQICRAAFSASSSASWYANPALSLEEGGFGLAACRTSTAEWEHDSVTARPGHRRARSRRFP